MFGLNIIISIALTLTTIYLTYKCIYSYWKRRNIPFIKPLPLVGNLLDLILLKVSFGELFQQLYEHPTLQNRDYGGIFVLQQPALIIREPELIRKLLIKDFDMFLNRFEAADQIYDHMGFLTLPLSKYEIWRTCRKKMSEVFTSGKIKYRMYPLMLKIAQELESYILRQFENTLYDIKEMDIEVKEMCSLFTTDLTSVLHYGVDVKGLKTGHSSLRQQTKELFKANFKQVLNFLIVFFLPHLTTVLRAKVFSSCYSKFMRDFTLESYWQRQKIPEPSLIQGDLLDVLQRFQNDGSVTDSYSQHPDFIPSQVAIFLLAGFETSSSVIGFILYELSKYPEIQQRLRSELNEAFSGEKCLSYEKLQELSYLHGVVSEGLRMYPAAAFINRECTPGKDSPQGFYLKPDLFVPKGMPLYVSILGLHRDPKHWPEPHIFRPERFAPDNLPNIHPMTYLPFGAGPHGCIGSRLGLLQVKLGLAHILRICRVQKCTQTPTDIKFDAKSFMLQAKGGIYLKFIKEQNG
ncbi:LOW QUALITY PROTEIN: probable cytochrome P450 6t3 [Lucilia sericata]|uniref:LOW QUALITY PROTEIN: probable cytochrome P450 6t3 n=1 Tax=Lucilia sericata TaxID=13632 RepID=UPI0018A7E8E2|nr:LOW QUALITY PROTEIN: probable cytochrome P450 6t3 [Lucilia sericata]